MYDAIVIGLGPAGSIAARELSKSGYKVLGLEKERHPRYKPCGGCLSAKIGNLLDLNAFDTVPISRIEATFQFKDKLDFVSSQPVAYMVQREEFDQILCGKAKGAGAEIIERIKANGIRRVATGVEVLTERGTFRGKVLLCADGAHSQLQRFEYRKQDPIALTCELRPSRQVLEDLNGKILIDAGVVPGGYAWVFPKRDTLSIGVIRLMGRMERLRKCFDEFAEGLDFLERGQIQNVRGYPVPTTLNFQRPLVDDRILLLGDAAHLVDPFTGEGIYYAIRSGQLAAQSASEFLNGNREELTSYDERIEKEILLPLKPAEQLVKIIYHFQRFGYHLLQVNKELADRYFKVMTGGADYREFLRQVQYSIIKFPIARLFST